MGLDKDSNITEEQALHIANIMHRFWDILAVDVVEDRIYMATNKLGVIVITENGIHQLTNDMVNCFPNYQNGGQRFAHYFIGITSH